MIKAIESHSDVEKVSGQAVPNSDKRCLTAPRRIKDLLKSPLHMPKSAGAASKMAMFEKQMNINKSTMPNNHLLEPRHTSVLRQSPLHRTSASSTQKFLLPASKQKENFRSSRKLEFNKCAWSEIEAPIVAYLSQTTSLRPIALHGIQKLSVKDLVRIMSHFLGFTGVLARPLDKDNYIEQISLAMQRLKYPHKLRDSWLLVPSASMHHILLVLDFLMDFAPIGIEFSAAHLRLPAFSQNNKEKEPKEKLDNLNLKQEFQDLDNELLMERPKYDSIKQQLQETLKKEAALQKEIGSKQPQLNSLKEQNAQLEQSMAHRCLEIWRKEIEKKDLVSRLMEEGNGYAVYSLILEEVSHQMRKLSLHLKQRLERTQETLQRNIEECNSIMEFICSRYGTLVSHPLMLPPTPSISQVKVLQHILDELRSKI